MDLFRNIFVFSKSLKKFAIFHKQGWPSRRTRAPCSQTPVPSREATRRRKTLRRWGWKRERWWNKSVYTINIWPFTSIGLDLLWKWLTFSGFKSNKAICTVNHSFSVIHKSWARTGITLWTWFGWIKVTSLLVFHKHAGDKFFNIYFKHSSYKNSNQTMSTRWCLTL